jgi:hypothetical protein
VLYATAQSAFDLIHVNQIVIAANLHLPFAAHISVVYQMIGFQ